MTADPLDGQPGDSRRGSIYDLGYRGYEGPRLGRRAAIWSLLTHSLRTAYGLGRNARSKIVPVGLTALAVLPSLVAIGFIALLSQFGEAGEAFEALNPVTYGGLFQFISILAFLFSAAQAPELFGRDQLAGVLPLYFSRSVSRLDYATARSLGLLGAVLVIVLSPYLLLLVGRVLVASEIGDGLAEELPELPAILAMALVTTALVGMVSAAVSALTPRRSYATVAIIAVFLVPVIATGMLVGFEAGFVGQIAVLFSPGDILDGVNFFFLGVWVEDSTAQLADLDGWVYLAAAIAWIAVSVLIVMMRYRRIAT